MTPQEPKGSKLSVRPLVGQEGIAVSSVRYPCIVVAYEYYAPVVSVVRTDAAQAVTVRVVPDTYLENSGETELDALIAALIEVRARIPERD